MQPHHLDILVKKAPDEITILKFRRFLEENRLQERMFRVINELLEKEGLLVKEGTTVDATILPVSSSTKNKSGKRDPEMHSTKKGNNYYFGMKAHVGTDNIECTATNVHGFVPIDKLLHGSEEVIYGLQSRCYVRGFRLATKKKVSLKTNEVF